jgi:glycosyltransferase involved in cell wall biosynthesis
MKVLLVTPEYPPLNIGGGGIVYENLSKQLKKNGHCINVVAGNFSNRKLFGRVERFPVNSVNVNFVPLLPFPKSKKFDLATYTFPTLNGILYIVKELVRSKNEVIHLHGFFHPIINITAFLCIVFRKKYILTCHGIAKSPEIFRFPSKNLFELYLSTIERTLVRKASALTMVSCFLMTECKSKNLVNKHMIVIPNGPNSSLGKVNPNLISGVEKKYSLNNKKLIFAIGRISPNKGFQFLIDAMQIVVAKVPNAVAVIAGSGSYKSSLVDLVNRKGLSNNVKLVGWVNEESKAALYERSEVVVFPSLYEPFGIVILEALMMHKPIVAFNTKSSKETIKKDTGLLVPTGNSKELADAILRIVTDSQLREKLVANTNRSEILSWEEISNKYVEIYNHVMKKEC